MRALIAAVLIAAPVFALLAILAAAPAFAAPATIADGNTLILGGIIFRLDGIDAPQTDQTCIDAKGAAWSCGVAARDALREHVGTRDVRCTDRGADKNAGKRRIGECRIAGETVSLNQWMVREGFALNLDRSAKGRYKADRDAAAARRAGLWQGCFIAPDDLRRISISTAPMLGAACPEANDWKIRKMMFPEAPAMPAGCDIKGRAMLRSQMQGYRGIYHLPACRSYARTPNTHRWFCSEDEARAAGFRKSYTC